MEKKTILIMALALLILTSTSLLASSLTASQDQLIDKYSFTKAICTEDNFCQDYILVCKNKNLESMDPITGASIQFAKTWTDPRSQEQIEKLC